MAHYYAMRVIGRAGPEGLIVSVEAGPFADLVTGWQAAAVLRCKRGGMWVAGEMNSCEWQVPDPVPGRRSIARD